MSRARTLRSSTAGRRGNTIEPVIALELVGRQVAVIVANTPGVLALKAAITTTPIVFTTASDPVQIGLVASLNRPGGNLTGVTFLNVEIVPKMLELLHEVVPTATTMAALVNPTNPNADTWSTGLQVAARAGARTQRPEGKHRARY